MIFKLVKPSECTLFCKLSSQTLCRNIHVSEVCPVRNIKSCVNNYHNNFASKTGRRIRKVFVKVNQEHIESVTAVLKKHNIDTSNLDNKSKMFRDTPWGVEKKIMLLQELGASNITTKFLTFFHRRLELKVKDFKEYLSLSPDKPLAENLFPYMNNYGFNPQEIGINEDQLTKIYLHRCLIHYTKVKLELNQAQIDKLENRNDFLCLFHSFRLLSEVLQFLQDIQLSKNKIIRHHVILFSLHPDQLQVIYNLVAEVAKEHTRLIAQQYPPMFAHNLEDLKIIVSFLKKHILFSEKVVASYLVEIFQITSTELKRRFDYLSKNCYTQNLLKHPRFISLIALYHRVLPRLQYLEEQNLQYATVESLTKCFRENDHEDLATFKNIYTKDLNSFFHVNFGNDAEKALQIFKKHVHYRFVPLLSMRKSLDYLRRIFSDDVIKENSYAILYNELDLLAAYEYVKKNPDYCKLPPNQLLTMCLYQIELNNHFMGEAVLAPGKYAESLKENANHD